MSCPPINVAQYKLKNGKYEEDEISQAEADELGDKAFKYSWKWYMKCQRKWQFRRK